MAIECVAERKGIVVTHQHCPDQPYLELRIPDDADAIIFIECFFVGRDQGNQSHTSARVENPTYLALTRDGKLGRYDGAVTDVSYTWVDATIERPSGRNVLGTLGVKCNTPPAGTRTAGFRMHRRRWDMQSKKPRRVWHDLQPGDVVQMIPRANYPGWACLVCEARIKIGYEPTKKVVQTHGDTTPSPWPIYPSRLDSKDHEVRILVVEPALSAGDPIICSLVNTRLSSAQPFDALSYCWGAGTSKKLLTINDRDLLVSSSVVTALRRLRHKKQELAIWIDQICINQRDVDERNEQVRLMAEIYSRATQVHVWLGQGDVATWTALRIVRDSFNMNYQVCPGGVVCNCHGTTHTLEVDVFTSRHRHDKPSPHLMNEVFHALVKNERGELADAAGAVWNNLQLTTLMSTLFINPWFRRVWVLQEALLAQDVIVHCGEELVPWREVLQISDWLADIHQPVYHVPYITMPHVWSLLRPLDGQVQELELLDVFIHGLEMKATDPRDKLFALFSFARGTGKGTEVPLPIRSSYKKGPEQVFADFTVWWIRQHQSLSILSLVHSHRDRTWRRLCCGSAKPQLRSPAWTIGHEGQAKWARITLDAQFDFCASAGTVPDEELLDQSLSNPDLRLRLRGFEMTVIKDILHLSLGEYSKPLIGPAKKLLQVFDVLFDPCGRHGTWNSKFKGLDWARPASMGADRVRQDMFDHANTHSQWEQHRSQPSLLLPRHMSENLVADKQLDSTSTGLPTCLDPFVFEAENGVVGICPWMAEKGDRIVFLYGGKVPYLLRPESNVEPGMNEQLFQFIGECYVMGAMYGKWFERQTKKGLDPQTFTII